MPERKYAGIVISEIDFLEIAQRYCNDSNLPNGCEVLAVNYDVQRQAFIIKVFHEDFDILTPSCLLPYIKIEPKEKDNA